MDLVQATFNGQILHPCAPSLTFSTDSHHKSLIWPNLWPKIEYIYRKYYFAIGLVISTHKFAKEQQFIFHKKGNDKKTQIISCCWNTIKCCRSWSYLHSTAQSIVEMLMHYGATWNGVKWRHCSRWNSRALIFLCVNVRSVWKVLLSIQMQQILIKVKLCSYPIFLLNNNRWVLLTLAHTISIHYALHSVCCIVWLWWRESHPFILLRFKLFAFVHFLYQFFSSLFCPFHWGRVDNVALVSTLPSPYSPRSGQII